MANAPSIPTRNLPSNALQADAQAAFAPVTGKSLSRAPQDSAIQSSDRPIKPALGDTPINRILELGRWAPSGDNTQPWRFEVAGDRHLVVHGRDTRHDCVYDLRGHASQIALGALLETISIAATTQGLRTRIERRANQPDDLPLFDVTFDADRAVRSDPLAQQIRQRVTQRRPLRTRALAQVECDTLARALPAGFSLRLLSSLGERFRIAKLLYRSAWIRLTTREAFETHRKVIQWNARESEDRIPDQAVGVDPLTRRLMQWAMKSWSRITFMNRFMAGTVLPRLQLDFMPGLRCGAHFFLVADQPPKSTDDFVAAGRALQRFWLTAAELNLLLQPEMTPLIFSEYSRDGLAFSTNARAVARAAQINEKFTALLGSDTWPRVAFMGRLGFGKQPASRSTRLPLSALKA
ncbi:MAG: hypothetical protein WD768_14005 [Phycisphaeraceae bacterium]